MKSTSCDTGLHDENKTHVGAPCASTCATQVRIHLGQREVEGLETPQQRAVPEAGPEVALLVAVAVTGAALTPRRALRDTQQHGRGSEAVCFGE